MPATFRFVCLTIHIENDYWHPFYVPLPDEIECLVGQLEVTQTGSLHWQMYAESTRPFGLTWWKEALMCPWVHLEARKGTRQQALAYVSKMDSRIQGPDTAYYMDVTSPSTKSTNLNSPYKRAMEAPDVDQALNVIREYAPRDFVIYNSAISNTMKKLFEPEMIINRGYVFNTLPLELTILQSKSIVITGLSGAGKTQYALSHFQKPLLCSHVDDLKSLRSTHDGIVFDDMSFRHWPAQSCIHLVDIELPRSINVKYGTARIPAGMPRFFTSNKTFLEIFSENITDPEWAAIERRCHVIEITESLFE